MAVISLAGLIGLPVAGLPFGRILAVWFAVVGPGMLMLVLLVARYGVAGAAGGRDRGWIRGPVDADLEERLFAASETVVAGCGPESGPVPEPRKCGLVVGASPEATRELQCRVQELRRDSMACHDLGIAFSWIAAQEDLFEYVLIDVAGMGARECAGFCRWLRATGVEVPVLLVMPFPAQPLPELPAGMAGVHPVAGGGAAVRLGILSALEPWGSGAGAAERAGTGIRGGLRVIDGGGG